MLRLGAIFIAICMVLIAGSAGAALYLGFGMSGAEATMVGVAVLTGLALYNTVSARLSDRSQVAAQIADLSRATADLAKQVAEHSRQLAAIEGRGESINERTLAATAPLSAELGELGTLVKQLAESVAVHEAALAAGKFAQAHIRSDAAHDQTGLGELGEPEAKTAAAASGRLAAIGHDAVISTIRGAIEANRIDLYLQPIVTLPQRKVRYYEALTRLRTEDGQMLLPGDFIAPSESVGLMPRIDHLLLFRSVQVVRRLLLKNREVGLFCNISAATLNDPQLFPQMSEFMEANRALAPALILEFKQATWRNMGPMEQESLAALRDLGFRYSMDHVGDLRMEPKDLAERGIRFVKAPVPLLLGRAPSGSDIHPADLSDLLGRFGISLIAERIENESEVVDLLDHDLRFGQGFLFSPPRPVRAEALQGEGEPAGANDKPRSAAL